MAILSAEVYSTPGIPFARAAATKKSPPPSRVAEEGPRKRARTQGSTEAVEREDEGGKRARGRPRLDVKDETAADRRRTQIRLAQRAYRNRKENAIQTLEKRVQELKDANEEMSNVFLQLHDFALSTGALDKIPEFGRQLRQTTEKFLALARKASEDGSKDDDTATGSSGDGPKGGKSSGRADRTGSSSPEPTNRTQQDIVDTTRNVTQPMLYGGFTITHEPLNEADLIADFSTNYIPPTTSALDFEIITQPTLENASFPFGAAPEFDFGRFSNPSPSPHNPLPLPRTYTSQEATFGRRLQRFACERALVLVSMPHPPPERFNSVFGFCLLVETKDDIHKRLQRTLGRNIQENLFNWQYPFYNLGGAGTHFGTDGTDSQRAGNQGTIDVFKPQSTNGYSPGPFGSDISGVRDDMLDKDMRIDLPGFRGDFYDCDEVELYLRQRGVTIPPGADHITIEIDPAGFGSNSISATTIYPSPPTQHNFSSDDNSNNSLGLISPPTSGSPASSTDGGQSSMTTTSTQPPSNTIWSLGSTNSLVDPLLNGLFSQSTNASYLGMTTTSAPDFSSLDSNSLFGYSSGPTPARRERAMVDVKLLILKMTENATCLGRSPGFRPGDINTAFWKATKVIGN
ncbi:AP-1-like transcription factor [Podospora aff. communis PSN243]|uniref:AP-1-like transcription factor n=1 Tax=Podospora aff. communis PSN243 TaxID=3040156 RepID=A0AAV9GZA1_9PEZI|nr:AP-1-like transcription factor [Podospora aff. communis PSN243]